MIPKRQFKTSKKGTKALEGAIRDLYRLFAPPPRLSVSEWADTSRYLSPEASAEPGKWHNSRNPLLVEPMDALSPTSEYHTVVCKFSSQTGKTEVLNNFVGYIIDQDPGPVLVLQPNVKPMAEAWSKDRLAPMIRDTPSLRGKIQDARSRDSGNTVSHKAFPGGHITIAGANSPAGLASRPIRYVLADEINRYPASAGTEGSPLKLARKRQVTFWNKKCLLISSPTVPDFGISAEYELSDKRKYYVRCPECDHEQILVWKNVKWPKGRPEDAAYACEGCGVLIPHSKKFQMIAGGRWIAERPEVKGIAGFWSSQLYSPFVAWGDTAKEFLDAKDDPEKLKAFINTALSEDWVESGDAPSWEEVWAHRISYQQGVLPRGVQIILMSVDVQKDRLVYVVRGWGANFESWLIEHGELYGDTSQAHVWGELATFNDKVYGDQYIRMQLVDSGYRADMVYEYCRVQAGRALPTKGHDTMDKPYRQSKVEVNYRGKVSKYSLNLWHLDSGFMKSWVHARVKKAQGDVGGWHLPLDITEDYCKQVVAEGMVQQESGKMVWVLSYKDNHYLDCEAMQAAGAHLLGLRALKPLAEEEVVSEEAQVVHQLMSPPDQVPTPPPPRPMVRQQATVVRRMRSSGVTL